MLINYEDITLDMINLYENDFDLICDADNFKVKIYIKD